MSLNTSHEALPRTRAAWEKAQHIMIGGGQAHRQPQKYIERNCPGFATRGKCAYFWDVDDHRYLDFLCGYGPIILGHADEEVNSAVSEQLTRGTIFSLEHPLVLDFVDRLCQTIPCGEVGTVLTGGSSATLAAVRCARAHTQRHLVARCGYNGWFDWTAPIQGGIPQQTKELTHVTPFNDVQALEDLFKRHGDKIACLVLEGIQEEMPRSDFVAATRRVCDAYGAVFILDEVKTGFRVHPGGAQALCGYEPDIAALGKAIGNGFPTSAIVGKRHVLNDTKDVFIGATFHGELASIAACNATQQAMIDRNGFEHIRALGGRLQNGLNKLFEDLYFPATVTGCASMPALTKTTATHPTRPLPEAWKALLLTEWCAAMQRRGYFMTAHLWFLTVSHTKADIDATLVAAREATLETVERMETVDNA